MFASMSEHRRVKFQLQNRRTSELETIKKRKPQLAEVIDEILEERKRNGNSTSND